MPTNMIAQIIKLCLIALLMIQNVNGYIITLDPQQEECFNEQLGQGSKIKFIFEVLDGGSLDIDLLIRDPSETVIHQENAKSSGRYTIEANQGGTHTYCFGNKMSSQAQKIVLFTVDQADVVKGSDQEHDKLHDMVTELSGLLTGVKHEMDFLGARDRLHRTLSERVNSRVVMWSLFEFLLLLIVAVGQTVFIKRFFETRRKV